MNGVHPSARFNIISAEPYNPNCFAQQLGLLQGLPSPYESVVSLKDKPSLFLLEMDQIVTANNSKLP